MTVARAEFVQALKVFAKLAKSASRFRAAQFTLAPAQGGIELIGPGVATTMQAEGYWPGRATFSSSIVLSNLKAPPDGTLIVIRSDKARVWFSGMSVPCVWQDLGPMEVDEAVGLEKPTDHLDALEMEARHSDAVLITQGHSKELLASRDWRKRRILDALSALAEFGVTYDDLVEIVARAIRRRAK